MRRSFRSVLFRSVLSSRALRAALVALAFAVVACEPQQSRAQQTPSSADKAEPGQQGYSFTFGPMNGPMMQGSIMFGQAGRGPGMGGGMMGQGMMGGMMGPGMMGMGTMGMMDPTRHLEGRLAFLKTELKITEQQTRAWNAFADAYRASAKTKSEAMQQAMGQAAPDQGASGQAAPGQGMMGRGMMQGMAGRMPSLPEQIARSETLMNAHLEALRTVKGPATQLYAALSDEQKQTADLLLHRRWACMG